jgi:uncharacterized radical SAM superfamily Fe-S cluster-containing enzyme
MTERVAESTPAKQDRDEVFVEFTRSICPVCKVGFDAQVNIRDDKVYLRKRCREHGEFEALVYGDARMYVDSARFNKPGTIPLTFQTEVKEGCPSDCGLCPEHKQHAAWASSRSAPAATWTARSVSPTPATSPTGTRSPSSSARGCWMCSWPARARRRW